MKTLLALLLLIPINVYPNIPNEIDLKCLVGVIGDNNDEEVNFFFKLKNETLFDSENNHYYLKEKTDNFYIFGHKTDEYYEFILNRKNLKMTFIYNSGKNKSLLSCTSSIPLL